MTAPSTVDIRVIRPTLKKRRPSALRRLLRDPVGAACTVFITLLILVAVIGPFVAPFAPNLARLELTNAAPFTSDYLLGGDAAGRDILSRLIFATRGTLLAALVVLAVSVVIGVVAGLVAGYRGGRTEKAANWISDAVMAFPGVVLLIALYTAIGPSILTAMAVFGFLIAPSFYRLVRGVVVTVRRELYIDAAKVAGLTDFRIVFRHVLGAVRAPIIIQSAFVLGAGIGIQAGLEFLGLGNPRDASWGGILQMSFANIYVAGANIIAPALLITLTILAFVLLGNTLRDVLEQSSRVQQPSRRQRHRLIKQHRELPTQQPVATDEPLLTVAGLRVAYPSSPTALTEVVHGIDLAVRRGEIVGLVGESGSGKSQTAFSVLGILPKEAIITGGSIRFDGRSLLDDPVLREVRGRRIAYVPQEPMSNLDPTLTIGQQLLQGLRATTKLSKKAATEQLLSLLARVGIKDPEAVFRQYPHQISGGMAQRVLITGAIAGDPEIIIADEPTTALDVTVQADVLDLLRELRAERGLGMILVTHNLGVVADLCDTVAVMRDGRIVETGDVQSIFAAPQHPYTRELLAATTSGRTA